jgi:formate dehydrogenase major subunit
MLRSRKSHSNSRLLGTVQAFDPLGYVGESGLSRRRFLRASGLTAASLAGVAALSSSAMRQSNAQQAPAGTSKVQRAKTICPFCAVGCSIWAESEDGVWIGQEPVFESIVNMGTHCAKGAATRELALGERRLKYPTKLVDGRWTRISWDEAIEEIGNKILQVRKESGPDSVFWCGSSKFTNEAAYLHRKFMAMWGSNNGDHQARICHSTTVAGVASTFGYGAMTNSFNDIHNSKVIFLLGGNPAEAHPVSMLHLLHAKENGAKFIVVDPRFTRTAAHADEYVRIRSGTDVAFLWGVLHEILANGWEDKDYLAKRVFRFDAVRKEAEHWTAAETERVTGVPAAQIKKVAKMVSDLRPGTLIWCMGLTQSSIGINKVRAACIVQLALGNIGKPGGGANIFRGHDNVQGATDIGSNSDTLPAYYGLTAAAWRHWAGVWDVDYDWLLSRFASKEMMEKEGLTISRWHDGVLEPHQNITQPNPLRVMTFWGHTPNSQTRGADLKRALEKLDLLVIIDLVPTAAAVIGDRRDGVYLLPAGSTMECAGSVTNSQRALQWREKVMEPIFEAKSDYEITYLLARKLGFGNELVKHIKVENNEPVAEDITREFNRGAWSIGYSGQSPERLKLHMQHQDKFDATSAIGRSEPVKGEYYGLPWPCWGKPELKHPGSPLLYDISKPVAQGGLPFRAAWGTEHEGVSLLADSSAPVGSAIEDGHPEISFAMLEKLGWAGELTQPEMDVIVEVARRMLAADQDASKDDPGKSPGTSNTLAPPETPSPIPGKPTGQNQDQQGPPTQQAPQTPQAAGQDKVTVAGRGLDRPLAEQVAKVNWKTDLSGGIIRVAIAHGLAPFGNGKARCLVWTYPDPVPLHREPLYTARRDLLPKYATYSDRRLWRLPQLYASIQARDFSGTYPLVLTTGRLVEYEGGGDETRANKWLAELQQQMFAEINPADAQRAGIRNGAMMWVATPEGARVRVAALVTPRVGQGTVFLPFHFAGWWMGKDISGRYPESTVPYVVGESANTATTYGYDAVTAMQETKTTLCRIQAA